MDKLNKIKEFFKEHNLGKIIRVEPTSNWSEGERCYAYGILSAYLIYFKKNEIISIYKVKKNSRIKIFPEEKRL